MKNMSSLKAIRQFVKEFEGYTFEIDGEEWIVQNVKIMESGGG